MRAKDPLRPSESIVETKRAVAHLLQSCIEGELIFERHRDKKEKETERQRHIVNLEKERETNKQTNMTVEEEEECKHRKRDRQVKRGVVLLVVLVILVLTLLSLYQKIHVERAYTRRRKSSALARLRNQLLSSKESAALMAGGGAAAAAAMAAYQQQQQGKDMHESSLSSSSLRNLRQGHGTVQHNSETTAKELLLLSHRGHMNPDELKQALVNRHGGLDANKKFVLPATTRK